MYWYWCSPVEILCSTHRFARSTVIHIHVMISSVSFCSILYVHLPYDNGIEWLNGTLYHCRSHLKEMTVTVNEIVASITFLFHLCLSYVISYLFYVISFDSHWNDIIFISGCRSQIAIVSNRIFFNVRWSNKIDERWRQFFFCSIVHCSDDD